MIIATVPWHVDSLEGSDLTYLTLGLDSDPDGRMDATSGNPCRCERRMAIIGGMSNATI